MKISRDLLVVFSATLIFILLAVAISPIQSDTSITTNNEKSRFDLSHSIGQSSRNVDVNFFAVKDSQDVPQSYGGGISLFFKKGFASISRSLSFGTKTDKIAGSATLIDTVEHKLEATAEKSRTVEENGERFGKTDFGLNYEHAGGHGASYARSIEPGVSKTNTIAGRATLINTDLHALEADIITSHTKYDDAPESRVTDLNLKYDHGAGHGATFSRSIDSGVSKTDTLTGRAILVNKDAHNLEANALFSRTENKYGPDSRLSDFGLNYNHANGHDASLSRSINHGVSVTDKLAGTLNLVNDNTHKLDAKAYAIHTKFMNSLKTPDHLQTGGGLYYNHQAGHSASLSAVNTKDFGQSLDASATTNLWRSKDHSTSLDFTGSATQIRSTVDDWKVDYKAKLGITKSFKK